jgi:hypothetical protein
MELVSISENVCMEFLLVLEREILPKFVKLFLDYLLFSVFEHYSDTIKILLPMI